MNIAQVNFMFVYNIMKREKLNISKFKDYEFEDITSKDVKTILNHFLIEKGIIVRNEKVLSFGEDLDVVIQKNESTNLLNYNKETSLNILKLKEFREKVNILNEKSNEFDFINDFEDIVAETESMLLVKESVLKNIQNKNSTNNANLAMMNMFF